MEKSKLAAIEVSFILAFVSATSAPALGQTEPTNGAEPLPEVEVITPAEPSVPEEPSALEQTAEPSPSAQPQTSAAPDGTVSESPETGQSDFFSRPIDTTNYNIGPSKSELSFDAAASPASVTSIRYSEETTRNRRGYEDLLKPITGVAANNFDQGAGVGFGFVLRGFGERFNGSQVGLYIDGVPINQPSHQLSNGYGDLFPLIPELIDSFELTRGPFNVRAGPHAVAGSAFYTTADAPSSGATVTGGSFENARGLGVYNFGAGEVTGYGSLVGETTNGYRDNAGWDQVNTFNKFHFPLVDGKASVSFQIQDTDYDSPGFINRDLIRNGTISEKDARNPTDGGDTELQNFVFNYKQNGDQPFTANAYVVHAVNNRISSRAGTVPQPGNTPGIQFLQQDDRVYTGGTVEKYLRSDLPFGTGFDLLLGAGVKADFVEQDEFRTTARRIVSREEDLDFTIVNPFYYVQSNVKPFEWLKLTGGLRFDRLLYDIEGFANPVVLAAGTPIDISPGISVYQPKFGVTISPIKGLGLDFFANYGEGFRPPSANGNQLPNDSSLEEATLESREVGVQFNSPDGVWHFLASYYETDFTNELQGQGLIAPPISLGPSVRTGYDIEGRVRIYETGRSALSIYASYSDQDGRLTEPTTPGGIYVVDIAEFFVKYGFDFTMPVGGPLSPHIISLNAGQVWEGPRALNTTNTLSTDTFSRIDASLTYTNEDWKGMSAFIGVIGYPDGRLDETAFTFGGDVGVSAKAPITVQGGVFVPF